MFCWTVHVKRGQQPGGFPTVAVENEVYCFGGPYDGDQFDVHVFSTESLRWRKLTPVTTGRERHLEVPSRRRGHTAVLIEDIVYVWGGFPYCKWLYTFDVVAHRWFKPRVSGSLPRKRYKHSACVLAKAIYIYGGLSTGRHPNDIYKLETTTMVWSLINTRGTPPYDIEIDICATIIGTKMFVFGSEGGETISVFDTETNRWMKRRSVHDQGELCDHPAFTYNGALYIFGGLNDEHQDFNDLWKFSPETFRWKKVEPKGRGPGSMYSMSCCMFGSRVILFGGENSPDDLFILDLSPSLKTLCKISVIQYGLELSGLPHNIRWELAATTGNMGDLLGRQKRGISKDKQREKKPGGNKNTHKKNHT